MKSSSGIVGHKPKQAKPTVEIFKYIIYNWTKNQKYFLKLYTSIIIL